MKRQSLSLVFIAVLAILTSSCKKESGEPIMTNYTELGLKNNTVFSIAIDAQGTKWFGTDNGVYKYNGN